MWAVVVAVIISFVASSIYYIVFLKQWASVSEVGSEAAKKKSKAPEPIKGLFQLARTVILTLVVGYLVSHLHITDLAGAIGLSLILWIGFPVMLLSGSVMWEKSPVKLAVLHAGDSLMTLLIMSLLLTLWR
jgi:hypothetical protein